MPKKTYPALSAEFVRSILDYDPATGNFRWRWRDDQLPRWNTRNAGNIAGTTTYGGYVRIQIGKGLHYPAHILAWLHVYGEWRPDEIDHRHGVRNDNRITELRLADNSDNACNKTMQRNNTSGFVGVYFDKQRQLWHARVNKNRICHDVGFFSTAEKAAYARANFVTQIQGDFVPANPNRPRYRHLRDRPR